MTSFEDYDAQRWMSNATLNRVTQLVVEAAKTKGLPLQPFTVHDLRRTGSTLLATAALAYEGSVVRRLGYLLELAGHDKASDSLARQASKAKTFVPLDPSIKPIIPALAEEAEKVARWKLLVNETVETDA